MMLLFFEGKSLGCLGGSRSRRVFVAWRPVIGIGGQEDCDREGCGAREVHLGLLSALEAPRP